MFDILQHSLLHTLYSQNSETKLGHTLLGLLLKQNKQQRSQLHLRLLL
jgi:hypothetical protein